MKRPLYILFLIFSTNLMWGQNDTTKVGIPKLMVGSQHVDRIFGDTILKGQDACNLVSKKIIKNYESYSAEKFEKLRKQKNIGTQTMFDVAEFLRYKDDSISKRWYINFIDYTNAEFTGCNKNKTNLSCVFFKLAKAYYYTGNIGYAETYLNKAISAKCPEPCIEYYLSLVKRSPKQ